MSVVRLLSSDGPVEYELGTIEAIEPPIGFRPRTRVAYAAAHVVARADDSSRIDWDSTLAFRHHLWSLGFGVADAMDTAQRGMGLSSEQVRELIRRSAADAPEGALLGSGVTTDDLSGPDHTLETIEEAYLDQVEFVEGTGSGVVLMASRALAASATGPSDYARVYARILGEVSKPVILHWLGPMFDPQLDGYWGSTDPIAAMESLLSIIGDAAAKVDGIKISMLDEDLELELRRRLPDGVRCYTGDDFNFPALIQGDGSHHSDALLGIFDGIAPVAAAALQALDEGDSERYETLLAPTLPLSRHIFTTPTYHYKTGLVFLAYLSGHHDGFNMLDGQQTMRSAEHLGDLVVMADRAGLFSNPDEVARRLRAIPELLGVE